MTLTPSRSVSTERAAWRADSIPTGTFTSALDPATVWTVDRFTIGDGSGDGFNLANLLEGIKHGRGTRNGTYTRLSRGHTTVMSDTDAEYDDHRGLFWRAGTQGTRRLLIAGLGLGCALRVVLTNPHVEHVDVVELDAAIIDWVRPHIDDPRVTYHNASIFDMKWKRGTTWDTAWFDIWDAMCEDNLPEMAKLARSYSQRADWKGYWGKTRILQERDRTRSYYW